MRNATASNLLIDRGGGKWQGKRTMPTFSFVELIGLPRFQELGWRDRKRVSCNYWDEFSLEQPHRKKDFEAGKIASLGLLGLLEESEQQQVSAQELFDFYYWVSAYDLIASVGRPRRRWREIHDDRLIKLRSLLPAKLVD